MGFRPIISRFRARLVQRSWNGERIAGARQNAFIAKPWLIRNTTVDRRVAGECASINYNGLPLPAASRSGFAKLAETKTGGDGGIRTLDRALQPYNGLANRRLQPLGHISSRADMPEAEARRKRPIWDCEFPRRFNESGPQPGASTDPCGDTRQHPGTEAEIRLFITCAMPCGRPA